VQNGTFADLHETAVSSEDETRPLGAFAHARPHLFYWHFY
jgi:hypothetical protein